MMVDGYGFCSAVNKHDEVVAMVVTGVEHGACMKDPPADVFGLFDSDEDSVWALHWWAVSMGVRV